MGYHMKPSDARSWAMGKLLDQAIPEVMPAFCTIQLSREGKFVFLSFFNQKKSWYWDEAAKEIQE